MKKLFVLLIALVLVVPFAFASGAKESASAQRVVTMSVRPDYMSEGWLNNLVADFEKDTGIKVQLESTPGSDDEYDNKVLIDLLGGAKVDVLLSLGDQDALEYPAAGLLLPLKKAVTDKGYDIQKIWGDYVVYTGDEVYTLPCKQEIMCVCYNRDIFDAAGVAYPDPSWTWDDYLEIAKKLTDPAKGIWGSHMPVDNPYLNMIAKQMDIDFYTADGKSNYASPEFAESLQWFYDLSHKYHVQMTANEMKAEGCSWNYFALADNIGMYAVGSWFTRLLNSPEDYPRTWRYGIINLPSAGPKGKNSLGSMGFSGVNANAEHKEEAIELAIWLALNQYKYEMGIPARRDLSDADLLAVFQATADGSNGQITAEEMKNVAFSGLGLKCTEVLGPASDEYSEIIIEEAERFSIDQQDLATTISRIVTRVNEALDSL